MPVPTIKSLIVKLEAYNYLRSSLQLTVSVLLTVKATWEPAMPGGFQIRSENMPIIASINVATDLKKTKKNKKQHCV